MRDLNVRLGIALPTRLLLDYAERIRIGIPEFMRPQPKGVCGERRAEKWAGLLRRRWGGRHAAVPSQEPMESSELDAKVARINMNCRGDCYAFCYDWLRIRSRGMGSPGVPSSGTGNCMAIARFDTRTRSSPGVLALELVARASFRVQLLFASAGRCGLEMVQPFEQSSAGEQRDLASKS